MATLRPYQTWFLEALKALRCNIFLPLISEICSEVERYKGDSGHIGNTFKFIGDFLISKGLKVFMGVKSFRLTLSDIELFCSGYMLNPVSCQCEPKFGRAGLHAIVLGAVAVLSLIGTVIFYLVLRYILKQTHTHPDIYIYH